MGPWVKRGAVVVSVAAACGVVGVLGLVGYVNAADPRFDEVPLPEVHASTDPDVIARGEYLVYAVAHCSECHGARPAGDHRPKAGHPPLTGGQPIVTPFGTFPPSNLTVLGDWSDAELARVIRHGVKRDGRLSAFMKVAVGPMSDQDLTAIVSYLRTLPADPVVPAPSAPNFVGKALFAFGLFQPAYKKGSPAVGASEEPSVARGAYLARGPANCVGCHTETDPMNDMAFVAPEFSGGGAHPQGSDPSMVFVPPNLTPDPGTGAIASWTEDQFVARFRAGRSYPETIMPWESYGQVGDADLRSIWRFLRSLEPVAHDVGPSLQPAG